jgi:hypothetical protein
MKMIEGKPENQEDKQLLLATSPASPDLDSTPVNAKSQSSGGRTAFKQFIKVMTDWRKLPKRLTISLFALACILSVSFVLVFQVDSSPVYRQQAGEIAVAGVTANNNISYSSPVLTKIERDKAAADPSNQVYNRNEAIVNKNRDDLNSLLDAVSSAHQSGIFLGSTSLLGNPLFAKTKLTPEQTANLLQIPSVILQNVRNEARNIFSIWMLRNIRPEQQKDEISRLENVVYTPWQVNSPGFSNLTENERNYVVALVKPFIAANMEFDKAATEKKQDEARRNTREVIQYISKGQTVINTGDVITPVQVEMMERLGLREKVYDAGSIIAVAGLATALVLIMVFYIGKLFPQLWLSRKILALIIFAYVFSALGMRLLASDEFDQNLRIYLLPIATAAIVLSALFEVNLALFVNAILALMAGLVVGNLDIALVLFISGSVGALLLWKAERSIYFAYAGLAVAGTQTIVAFLYHLLRQPLDFGQFLLVLVYSALNGLISASLAFFIFSVLGRFFGVTTVVHLMELAHPTQPLLSRLSREAPGTYHHSMLVGTLAEQAAERLEGDSLLARVGAYYHDIGKLAKPANFIDNQGGGPNIHDNLDPRESAKIIRAHVTDGVELARKNHLPNRVVDIIKQHHGTCLISFFYQKALSMGLDVSELDFRYPGPKPQTKVAALVMLADASEAAVRANVQSGKIPTGAHPPNPSGKFITIADVVNKIVDDRIKDGQLDESDLTLREIQMVRQLFVEILTGIYHPRIDYPDTSKKPETNIQVVSVPAVEIPDEPITPPAPVIPSLTASEKEPLLPASSTPAADAGGELPPAPLLKEIEKEEVPPQPETTKVEKSPKPETEPKPLEDTKPKPGGIGGAGRRINPDIIGGGDKK